MVLGERDNDVIRRYLLGQLTDAEEQTLEEQLLTEDDVFQELQVTRDELVQDYASGRLSATESEWLQKNFLASPEGKQQREFAQAFDRYLTHRPLNRQSVGFFERLRALWTVQPQFLRAAAVLAPVLITVAVIWLVRTPGPQSIASLTLVNTSGTRSTDAGSIPTVRLKENALKLTLILPQVSSAGTNYQVNLMGDGNVIQTLETSTQDARSISIEIPANQLPSGQYVATVSTINASGAPQRIPGGYYFKIE